MDKSKWHKPDSERPLTSEGRRKMRKAAKGLKRLNLGIDWILTSPYRRAYDTAGIVGKALKKQKKIKTVNELAANKNPENLVRYLVQNYSSDATLLLVGHEPYLTRLISMWVGAAAPLALDFKKGGLCKLVMETVRFGRCATLEWWIPPKLLRRLR